MLNTWGSFWKSRFPKCSISSGFLNFKSWRCVESDPDTTLDLVLGLGNATVRLATWGDLNFFFGGLISLDFKLPLTACFGFSTGLCLAIVGSDFLFYVK